jgi:hypothetical protein
MRNFTNNSQNFTRRLGLYRVWVSLRDDGRAPLISIWIDRDLAGFKSYNKGTASERGTTPSFFLAHEAYPATLAESEGMNSVLLRRS